MQMFCVDKNCGSKRFWKQKAGSRKILGTKRCGKKNFIKKKICCRKLLVKNIIVLEINNVKLGPKIFWIKNFFWN